MERLGPDPAVARLVVVAVHGRSGSAASIRAQLVTPLVERLGASYDDIAWLLPEAPGGAWYPERFTAPLADNQPYLDEALGTLAAIADELAAAGVPHARIVWAGFSQGACLATEFVARHAEPWGGLLAFTGGMLGSAGTALWAPPRFDGMPAYFGAGLHDDWVPMWRVEETVDAYRSAGAHVTLQEFDDADHLVRPAELDAAADLLRAACA